MSFPVPSPGFASPVPAVTQIVLTATITASSTQNTLAAVQTTITPSGGSVYTYAGTLSAPTGSSAALDSATTANPSFTPDKPGIYTVTLTATDTASGATVTKVRTQEIANPLSIALVSSASSQDTLSAVTETVTPTGGIGTITYSASLTKPTGSASSVSGGTTTSPSFTPDKAGGYRLTVTATDAAGQTATASRFVEVGTAALSVSITAIGNNVNRPTSGTEALACSASGAVGSVTYAWTVTDPSGASVTPADATAASTTIAYTSSQQPGQWTAIVTVTDAAGRTARAAELWTTGGMPTATSLRGIYGYLSGGVLYGQEQVLIGSDWVDIGSPVAFTTETNGGVTLSGTTYTIPSGLAASTATQSCPDERYIAFSSFSATLQGLVAAGNVWRLEVGETSIEAVEYARWGVAVTSAAGSFDSGTENGYSVRIGYEGGVYRLQGAAGTAGLANLTTSATLGKRVLTSQIGEANTGGLRWAIASYGNAVNATANVPTRIYVTASAQTLLTTATAAVVAPWFRFAIVSAAL